MNKVLKKIQEIIEKNEDLRSSVPPREIRSNHHFKNDLSFDSMSLMFLAYDLQEDFPELDETRISDWQLVSDCIEYVEGL